MMYEYNDEDGGIQFEPYDDELINEYLIPKLKGEPCNDITTKDVYSMEPWLLDHPMGTFFKKNEWYYFATRTQLSKKKIGCGKKAKRKITRDDDSGFWRANAKEDIMDSETKMVIGLKQTLAFVKSNVNNNKKQKKGDGTSSDVVVPGSESSWIMTEYMLPEIEGKFQELVICKIHVINNSNKKKKDDRHEASTSSLDHELGLASFSSDQQLQHPINEPHRQESSTYLHNTLEQQPMNTVNQETFPAPFLEKQPSNIICNTQEDIKGDHHEFVADSSTKQQPVNEAHGHVPDIPLIGTEQEAEKEEEEGDWMQELINSLATEDISSLPMEEDDDMIYNTPVIDQDLHDQCATLRPQETSKTLGS